MSIATALTALADDVSAAKAAITAKGGTAPSGTADMADAIAAIPSGGITPTGNINITDTNVTDVTNYATAQVVDADLVASNIKKDVNILGVVGSFEGGGGTPSEVTMLTMVSALTNTREVREFLRTQLTDDTTIATAVLYGKDNEDFLAYQFASMTFSRSGSSGAYARFVSSGGEISCSSTFSTEYSARLAAGDKILLCKVN